MYRALLQTIALITLIAGRAPAEAGPLLDPSWGTGGVRTLATLGGYVEGIGSCPHANGSISLIGYRATTATLVIVRLTASGQFDTAFSGDGVAELPIGQAFDISRSAVSCSGVGNSVPEDDRAMVVGVAPGAYDLTVAALLDLHAGSFDSQFYLGGPGLYDLGGVLFPPQNQVRPYPITRVQGVFPGPAGGWLVAGQFDGHASGVPAGFIARLTAGGAVDAITQPIVAGFTSRNLSTARVGADGDIRVLGDGTYEGGYTWGLLRLDPASLQPIALSDHGVADIFPLAFYKGRQIGGGLMVAAALQFDASPFGASPWLMVVRGDEVSEVALPAAPMADGVPLGPSGLPGSAAATGAAGNRAVFAMGLRSLDQAIAGYYVAMVQLGDGAGTPDVVDTRFARDGAGSFRYRVSPTSCAPTATPPQRFANLSSWGDRTLLVGSVAPDCAPTGDGWMLSARLLTDGETLHRDGFE
ncbi:MAG: hypothetical protein IPK27_06265 [Rhodanobacteraceae bacterium]|nr:hypothetical protein [Rhodanobacteraceae bacterium]